MMGAILSRIESDRGQMTVELCVVFPVVIIIAVILVNALTFFGDCAAFDRACRNAIRANASSISGEMGLADLNSAIVGDIEKEMERDSIECALSGSLGSSGYLTAEITYVYEPTLFGMPIRTSFLGVSLPKLEHTSRLTVDPYSPGKWLTALT